MGDSCDVSVGRRVGAPARRLVVTGVLAAIVVAVMGAWGCTSGGAGGGDSWSRSYVRPYDRVWEAVLFVLADTHYLVERSDHDPGLVVALSSASRRHREVTLDVRVVRGSERVRVDVQARAGQIDGPADVRRMETRVLEFLGELDRRLGVTAP